MERVKYEGKKNQIGSLLQGYLYGLGEVCHGLFGAQGEIAMFKAIGSYFLWYIKQKMNVSFTEEDPWRRYCHIIEVFTEYGFYSSVEIEKRSPNSYWMIESDQYAGEVWEEQKSWERGTPPCPLWSVVLYSLSQIGFTIVLDSVRFNQDARGYESVFHFEELAKREDGIMERTRKEVRSALLPICANCKGVRDKEGNWVQLETYFKENFDADFTHTVCPACAKKLYNV